MKPLILLGNGKSLKNMDLNQLSSQDTFGLNGAFIRFQELNWFPKYYGYFCEFNQFWDSSEITDFIVQNYDKCEKFFCFERLFKTSPLLKHPKVQVIRYTNHIQPTIDGSRCSLPFTMDLDMAHRKLSAKYSMDEMQTMFERLQKMGRDCERFNANGIVKMLENEPLTEWDYITRPRFDLGWTPPTDFDHFVHTGGNSGYFAALVSYLLGYKKVILLGFDFNFQAKNNIVDTTETFWFDHYFRNKSFNVKKLLCSSCKDDTMYKMELESFQQLKDTIEANKLDFELVNCTEGSKLDLFRKSTLEKEL